MLFVKSCLLLLGSCRGVFDTKLVNCKINSLINKVIFKQCKKLSLFYFYLKDFLFVCILSLNLDEPSKLYSKLLPQKMDKGMVILKKKRKKATISTCFGGLTTGKETFEPHQKKAKAQNVNFNSREVEKKY